MTVFRDVPVIASWCWNNANSCLPTFRSGRSFSKLFNCSDILLALATAAAYKISTDLSQFIKKNIQLEQVSIVSIHHVLLKKKNKFICFLIIYHRYFDIHGIKNVPVYCISLGHFHERTWVKLTV